MLLLQNDSLDWALAHVNRYGDTDVFPVPFEYAAIEHDWTNVKHSLAGVDCPATDDETTAHSSFAQSTKRVSCHHAT